MLKLMDIEEFTKDMVPVRVAELFTSKNDFHPEGLLSENIFGPLETSYRRTTYSYIDLKTEVIHPAILKILIQLDRKIEKFISSEANFIIDNNGILVEDPNGITGINKFREIFPIINFRSETSQREKYINLIQKTYKNKTMFIKKLPVIPPGFRPAYQDNDGVWMVDKLNEIYQGIIRKTIQVDSAKGAGVLYELLTYGLQLAINDHDEYIRSKISKKSGVVRNFMLGKRVDFSGRAVITPGSSDLNLNEIGLPLRMVVSIFEPFIFHVALYSAEKYDTTELKEETKKFLNLEFSTESLKIILNAIKNGDVLPEKIYNAIFEIAEIATKDRVVIAKRDPVLHPESLRGMYVKVIDGDSIKLCPLQTSSFNADFDGDTMAIYHPLTKQSQEEVKQRMMNLTSGLSSNALTFSFEKEMFVGLFLMTKESTYKNTPTIIHDESELNSYSDPYVLVKYRGEILSAGRALFNSFFPSDFPIVNKQINKKNLNPIIMYLVDKYDKKTVEDTVSKMYKTAFKFATILAPSLTLNEIEIPDEIYQLKEKLDKIPIEDVGKVIDEMKKILIDHLKGTGLYDLIESGSGKGWDQPMQILVAKGIVADAKGNVVGPIKGSFADGFSNKDFFNSSYGARNGIVNRVINTSSTGYLARKLVYILNGVEADLFLKDCGTTRTLNIKLTSDIIKRLKGRFILKNDRIEEISPENSKPGETIQLRSPIYCKSPKICHTCYGKLLERHKSPFVGMMAALYIGERSTQLIMKAFHMGGTVKIIKRNLIEDILRNNPSIKLEK